MIRGNKVDKKEIDRSQICILVAMKAPLKENK